MARHKLTVPQILALNTLRTFGVLSAYAAQAKLTTMRALERRDLVKDVTGNDPGLRFFPRGDYKFKITPAGRTALDAPTH